MLAHPIPLYEEEPGRVRLGRLRYEAGFVLTSADSRFGGLSGLQIAPDGRDLLALSDHGVIWRASLEHAGDRLVGLVDWQPVTLGRMPGDPPGRVDTEALAQDTAGDLVIAVEGPQPLRRVALDDLGATAQPVTAAAQLDEAGAKAANSGIEALTALPGGALLAIAEGVFDRPEQLAAWRIEDDRVERLRYAVRDGFVPTGADGLDDQIYVVERRFSLRDGGFAARLMVLDAADVGASASMRARELARLAWPSVSDNFEGIAARRGPDGRILLYVISDDNFLALQRTLLLQFSLQP